MSGWTSGPWKAEKMDSGRVWITSEGEVIAEIQPWSEISDLADGHLIAAAPDLYEALELVAQRCGPLSADGAMARAALAKARGEA